MARFGADDVSSAHPEGLDVASLLAEYALEVAPAHYTFFVRPQDNLVIAVSLAAKHEMPGVVRTTPYIVYDAIGCRHGATRGQIGPMAIAEFEVNSYPQVDEATARQLHPELFAYLAEDYGYGIVARVAEEPVVMATSRRQKSGRASGVDGPTKKKDFRFPLRLLDALKAVSDDEHATDTQIIIELLKADPRIQRKLFEDSYNTADFYVEEDNT